MTPTNESPIFTFKELTNVDKLAGITIFNNILINCKYIKYIDFLINLQQLNYIYYIIEEKI